MTSDSKSIKGYGLAEDENSQFRDEMEDGHLCYDELGKDKNIALVCVFDGHGGKEVVNYLEENFLKVFEKNLENDSFLLMENVLESTFAEIDGGMKHIEKGGATAAVVVIVYEDTEKYVYSANCGDARTVLVKKSGTGVRLSMDHKASLETERERIKNAGGFVSWGRVNGTLEVSRAFGDLYLKNLVVSTPYITKTRLTADDAGVVLACDGLWDVVDDDEAAACVAKIHNAADAAAALKDLALAKHTTDNITVIVIEP